MEQIQLRENCIGIKYNRGLLQQFHYELILDDILGIPDEENMTTAAAAASS